jgi:tRNA G18 (ribose-2'-O)-methylase SpoU
MNALSIEMMNSDRLDHFPLYLVIYNIQKRNNVRSLLTTAAAFGVQVILMVGLPKFDCDPHGKDIPPQLKKPMEEGTFIISRFVAWKECNEFLREHEIRLLGIEIHKDAAPVESFFDSTFDADKNTAILMGNEGQGLSETQMKSCRAFIKIPQYGQGTASLNVNVAASIVLQRFHGEHRRRLQSTIH